jgi:hypothetical protein
MKFCLLSFSNSNSLEEAGRKKWSIEQFQSQKLAKGIIRLIEIE